MFTNGFGCSVVSIDETTASPLPMKKRHLVRGLSPEKSDPTSLLSDMRQISDTLFDAIFMYQLTMFNEQSGFFNVDSISRQFVYSKGDILGDPWSNQAYNSRDSSAQSENSFNRVGVSPKNLTRPATSSDVFVSTEYQEVSAHPLY